jgi:hypothetical protein
MGLIKKTRNIVPDRRQAERHRVLWGSWIAHLDGSNVIKCQTRDISVGGVRIHLSEQHPLPPSVYFLDVRNRLIYESAVIWRNLPEAGLKFGQVYRFVDAPTPELVRVIQNITL